MPSRNGDRFFGEYVPAGLRCRDDAIGVLVVARRQDHPFDVRLCQRLVQGRQRPAVEPFGKGLRLLGPALPDLPRPAPGDEVLLVIRRYEELGSIVAAPPPVKPLHVEVGIVDTGAVAFNDSLLGAGHDADALYVIAEQILAHDHVAEVLGGAGARNAAPRVGQAWARAAVLAVHRGNDEFGAHEHLNTGQLGHEELGVSSSMPALSIGP